MEVQEISRREDVWSKKSSGGRVGGGEKGGGGGEGQPAACEPVTVYPQLV